MDEGKMIVDDCDEGDIIINEVDGLPGLHETTYNADFESILENMDSETYEQLINDEDLPTSLIVTNVNSALFNSDDLKKEFEDMFKRFGEPVTFQYFKSFKRIRVNYEFPSSAAKARIHLHHTRFCDGIINCYFAQPVTPVDNADRHLQLPAPVKQFLISPPSSPPVGWEPRVETEPLINYDLIAAIASLSPGMTHELLAPTGSQPGIVVHIADDGSNRSQNKPKFMHTKCPEAGDE
ncbi:protein sarah [Planococcus citri]|uniref:protein sarah n=1 Tax=Planococcus citri TaxID=170843 RepID=UPI0031F9D887